MNDLIQALQQTLLFLTGHLIEIFLGMAVICIHRWTGIQIEEKHMRVLQSAALNGVRLAIEGGLTGNALKQAALDYMRRSAPDAIKQLGAQGVGVLEKLVLAKVHEITKELSIPK